MASPALRHRYAAPETETCLRAAGAGPVLGGWGGFGDSPSWTSTRATISYMMNKMAPGIIEVGPLRGVRARDPGMPG